MPKTLSIYNLFLIPMFKNGFKRINSLNLKDDNSFEFPEKLFNFISFNKQ